MNLDTNKMRKVLLATLNDPRVASKFSRAEIPFPDHWATMTLVIMYQQVPYNMTRLSGAHKCVTINEVLAT